MFYKYCVLGCKLKLWKNNVQNLDLFCTPKQAQHNINNCKNFSQHYNKPVI